MCKIISGLSNFNNLINMACRITEHARRLVIGLGKSNVWREQIWSWPHGLRSTSTSSQQTLPRWRHEPLPESNSADTTRHSAPAHVSLLLPTLDPEGSTDPGSYLATSLGKCLLSFSGMVSRKYFCSFLTAGSVSPVANKLKYTSVTLSGYGFRLYTIALPVCKKSFREMNIGYRSGNSSYRTPESSSVTTMLLRQ